MTTDVFEGYCGEMAATEARRMLDQIVVAHPTEDLVRELQAMSNGRDDEEADALSAGGTSSMFLFNRRPVSLIELTDELAGALGGRFSAN